MIQRIFHPIGQGAFYSEEHENFNIVYDCGTEWKDRKNQVFDKVVKQSFFKEDVIDILFISHFDYDHISKIEVLLQRVKEIKKVVLPLLHDNEKNLLINIYRMLGYDTLKLIESPESFFGEKTQIIYVESSENVEVSKEGDIIDIENITETKIKSGRILQLKGDWSFVPFNYEYKQRNDELIKELEKEFDITKLKTNSNYTITEIIKDTKLTRIQGGKKFKDIYDSLNGKINQNSMLLYSGPLNKNDYNQNCFYGKKSRCFCNHLFWRDCDIYNRVGCIYTGDTDLNIVDIKSVYEIFWETVGTIQIPHHGDVNSFDKNILKGNSYCCPISFGNKNTYGHPSSKVIGEILKQRNCPILVTEEPNSIFIQNIHSKR